ncbi:MAG: hypothetical protein L6Q92_06555 [Phycisphaerae bacterium]|nr:hypothetical protein [Phycisphaerae bacterium]
MTRRARTRLCITLILLGLANFLSYTVVYAYIKGDAANGRIEDGRYYVRGHFIRLGEGQEREVSRWVWIYSYAHSISIWPSVACILLPMLVLARPLIIATYSEGILRGTTLVGVIATLIAVVTGLLTAFFSIDFIRTLSHN